MSTPCEQHRPGPAARAAAKLGGKIPSLDTRRLQLRGPRIYDFKAYAAILCSDRSKAMGGPYQRDEAWASFTQYTAQWMLHGHGLWTVDAQTMPSAGFVLLGYHYHDPEIELGVYMVEGAEGQGYAQEAVEAARDYAMATLKMDSLVSYIDASNTRASALMQRLGAVRDLDAEESIDGGAQVWRHGRADA